MAAGINPRRLKLVMIQNPAGRRNDTATDLFLREIRDALANNTVPPVSSASGGNITIALGTIVTIGTDFRLVSIAGGAKAEARDPATDTWAEVDRWTNP